MITLLIPKSYRSVTSLPSPTLTHPASMPLDKMMEMYWRNQAYDAEFTWGDATATIVQTIQVFRRDSGSLVIGPTEVEKLVGGGLNYTTDFSAQASGEDTFFGEPLGPDNTYGVVFDISGEVYLDPSENVLPYISFSATITGSTGYSLTLTSDGTSGTNDITISGVSIPSALSVSNPGLVLTPPIFMSVVLTPTTNFTY